MSAKKQITPPCQNNNHTVFSDEFVTDLIGHIRTSLSKKCSAIANSCNDCANTVECDGLLRSYLYNETEHLERAIKNAAQGMYQLDNNIPKFHTLAIQHLLQAKGTHYSVIQWIGSKAYSPNDEETYDDMDYDFLRHLITEVLTSTNHDTFEDAYFKKIKGGKRFKIRWLLVGNSDCMKNNYDYIFYTFKQLESIFGKSYYTALSSFFEFYCIDEGNYSVHTGQILASEHSQLISDMFKLDSTSLRPSFGLFGSRFMFVDGTTRDSHGTIYTKKYHENDVCPVENACNIFEKILQKATPIAFDILKEQYEKILENDPGWENKLKETLEGKWR